MQNSGNRKLIVKLTALAHGGACVGVVTAGGDGDTGKKAFVRGTIPGETVEAQVISDEGNYFFAEPVRLMTESAHRVVPPCPYFGVCGGCGLQHMSISSQREAKREMVETMILRQAGLEIPGGVELIGRGLPDYNWRRRISLHLELDGRLGFYRPDSNAIVEIDSCKLAVNPINETLGILKPILSKLGSCATGAILEEHSGEVFVEISGRERPGINHFIIPETELRKLKAGIPNFTLSFRRKTVFMQYHGEPVSREAVHYPTGHFSQAFEEGNSILKETVIGLVATDSVSDLYGGAGNFGLELAAGGKQVDIVDGDRALIAYGEKVSQARGLKASFFAARCEDFVKNHPLRSTVIMDPPRAGAKGVAELIRAGITSRVIYISCNLPSLCRDLKVLSKASFSLRKVMVLDMFPQSHFIESIAVLDAV